MDLDIEALIEKLGERFLAERAAGVEAVIQFRLEGEQAGSWYLQIKDQQCRVFEGAYSDPALSISADAQDLQQVLAGEVSLMKAFMSGEVQVRGDMGQAMRLMELFKRD